MARVQDFVGREAELSALRRAADEVAATGSPRFVLIEGLAGVGKTALLNEAVKYVDTWWRANVYLDVGDRFRPGYGATHLLRKPQRYNAPQDPAELQAWVQATADAISDPIVVVMEDLQWIDEMSAGIIFDVIREIEDVPMLNFVTMQTNNRECVTRFSRLAETIGEATHIVLEPFSVEEVGRHLSTITGMPISERVAEEVHGHTDGFPEFVRVLGRILGNSTDDLGRRLPAAFKELELESGPAGSHRRVVKGLLQECAEDVQQMLLLLSCAHRSLSAAEIGRALDLESVDVEALRRTHLVAENTISGRYSIAYGVVQRAIIANFSRRCRADLHRRLAEHDAGESAARHRSEAAVLEPSASPPAGLAEGVLESAAQASMMGDRLSALELTRLAFDVERKDSTLEAYAFAALRARRLFTLADSRDWIHDATRGSLRRALEAHDAIHRGDIEAGLALLSNTTHLHQASTITVLIYAEAVVQLARLLSLRGAYRRVARLVTEISDILSGMSTRVFLPGQAESLSAGAATLEHVHCEFVSIKSMLSMWSVMEDQTLNSREADRLLDDIVRTLERFPETEVARAEVLTGKGSRRRVSGDRVGAQASFLTSTSNWQDRDPSVPAYAQLNLCLLYFDAAMWAEAHRSAMSAAASVLSVREEQLGAIAYSLARLVPAARGRLEEVTWHEERLTAPDHHPLPLGEGSRLIVQAWGAISEGDHRSVVNHLLKFNAVGTLWSGTVQMSALLGRSYYYSGRSGAIAGLLREMETVRTEDVLVQKYVIEHLRALKDQAEGSPLAAVQHYLQALEIISSERGFNRSDIPGDGGTLRIYRALLALDLGYLVATRREDLHEHLDTAQGLLAWAASTFEACESEGLFQQADHLFIALQRNEVPPQTTELTNSLMNLPIDVSSEARFALASLTAREREISLMVGKGLANKQIAEPLVISVRTVEYHVANILGKLRLSSRHDLRRLLMEDADHEPGLGP